MAYLLLTLVAAFGIQDESTESKKGSFPEFPKLKGIESVKVLVQTKNITLEEVRLSEQRIQTVTELTLRKHGLKVIGPPLLLVEVVCLRNRSSDQPIGYTCRLSIVLYEFCNINRIPIDRTINATWRTERMFESSLSSCRKSVTDEITEGVELFCNAWLADNDETLDEFAPGECGKIGMGKVLYDRGIQILTDEYRRQEHNSLSFNAGRAFMGGLLGMNIPEINACFKLIDNEARRSMQDQSQTTKEQESTSKP